VALGNGQTVVDGQAVEYEKNVSPIKRSRPGTLQTVSGADAQFAERKGQAEE
jgi:hypothetical protein